MHNKITIDIFQATFLHFLPKKVQNVQWDAFLFIFIYVFLHCQKHLISIQDLKYVQKL